MPSRGDIFWDFKRFMSTEGIDIAGLIKEDLKKYYADQYTTYKKQISPDQKLPTFYIMMRTMLDAGKVHYSRRGKLVITEDGVENSTQNSPPKTPNNVAAGASNMIEGDAKSYASNANETGSGTVRKPVLKKNKVAVDQHMTFKSGRSTVISEQAFKGDPEEWKYIGILERGYYCTLCQSKLSSKLDTENHLAGKRHRITLSVSLIQSKKDKLIAGVSSIKITAEPIEDNNNGTYIVNVVEKELKKFDIVVSNVGNKLIELLHCEMMKKVRVFTLRDSKKVTDGMKSVQIYPGDVYRIQVSVQAVNVGSFHCPVMFHFIQHEDSIQRNLYVLRYLHCKCTNKDIDELKPKSQYRRPPRVNRPRGVGFQIIPGYQLPSSSGDKLEKEVALDDFVVPQNVRKMINRGLIETHGLTEEEINDMKKLKSVLDEGLNMKTYQEYFHSLLYFEEVQMEVDIRKYDMENVSMSVYSSNSRLLLLEVPGLSENRPSVLRGDWLYITKLDNTGKPIDQKEYQGYVHEVLQDQVALGFDRSFRDSYIEKEKVSVRFVFNRLPTRLQHRSCQLAIKLGLNDLLFPSTLLQSSVTLPQLSLYNRILETNAEQKCAVQHIVAGTSKPAPYIVFGPPGTGKTVTIVEAMKQVWKSNRTTCILACTPSNSAADLIAKRLREHVPKTEIIRLNAASRSWSSVPEDVKCICNFDTGHNYFPCRDDLSKYRVIITTLVTAGRLVSAKFPRGHFTHIFIDEAGHAPEPEALIAVAGLMEVNTVLKTGGQVVIAGDPKQLGPILRSPLAIKYGLDLSILERYMDKCVLYKPSEGVIGPIRYDTRVITKLLNNYRSHPAILKLPNKMFYDSELIPCADQMNREKLCGWEGLPNKGYPMLFHGVVGEDMREERSPSFFNPQEVSIVVNYVEELMACKKGGINLKQSDIGVISPYRKQVQKIQQQLRKRKFDKISVGSVEEFQGQERTVIIVSTVRSKPEFMSLDMKFRLGFLRNPKRFNVTVTRAKALLIVVGNPHTLGGDFHWDQLIKVCEDNNSYTGEVRMNEDDELEDLVQRLAAIDLIDEEYRLIPEIQSDYNEQAWRGDL
ncbi:Helicase MOV-10 [Mactra antiquata]